jgi:predicted DNA-binding transcriptional regulator AlpA
MQDMKLIDSEGLKEKGINFSGTHLRRLINSGNFPPPMKIGCRDHWSEEEIDEYIANKLAQRDHAAA